MEPVVALVAFGVCVVPGFALKLCACVDVCQEGFDGVRVLPCDLVVLSGGFVLVLGDDAGAGGVDGDCGGGGYPGCRRFPQSRASVRRTVSSMRLWVRTFGVNMRVLP